MKRLGGSKKILIFTVIIVLIVGIYSIISFFSFPKIILKGKHDMVIGYKTNFEDPGYSAFYKSNDLSSRVKVSGKVNTNKLGVYKIRYQVKYGRFVKEEIRKVKVRDTEKPTIKIEDDKSFYVCPGDNYKLSKYSAYDNYDHDITDKVKVTQNGGVVTYAVADSSGNTSIVQKKIHYKDVEGPKINIMSDEHTFIFTTDEYKEPEYTISDNCDEEIEKMVEGHVDSKTPGVYTIYYKAKDKSENETIEKRFIHVVTKGQNGTIYLTFDDGPRRGVTDRILDILKEENVKATFFVTSSGPDELIKRAYDEGHSIGLHTATHNYSYIYSSMEQYFQDLQLVHDRVYQITGYDSKLIRFPGGSSNTISRRYKIGIMKDLTQEVVRRGYSYYDWNVLSGDAGEVTEAKGVYDRVVKRLSKDRVNVVLMHDIKSYTRDSLRDIIQYGKENGYIFDKIDENTEMIIQKVNN